MSSLKAYAVGRWLGSASRSADGVYNSNSAPGL